MHTCKTGKWAVVILSAQQADGTWGHVFHSMAQPTGKPLTTEQALRRLCALGFTCQDVSIRRCVDTMAACLRGERKIDTYWEKGIDWAMFEPLMLAAWIRRFDPSQPDALAYAKRWAHVVEIAFSTDTFDESAWNTAYESEFHRKEHHPRPLGLWAFYHGMLLPNMLSPAVETAFVQHILHHGMYYIHPTPLIHPPATLASKQASYWLSALEILADYPHARRELAFAAAWLHMSADEDGQWDFGPQANDKMYFPLSDSWRNQVIRKADCTERVQRFLEKIN